MISFKISNAPQVTRFLNNKSKRVHLGSDKGIARATMHTFNEVQASVAGQRAEGPWRIIPRKVTKGGVIRGPIVKNSIDTTTFKFSIHPDTKNGVVYTKLKYAEALELGTTKTPPRRHFGNTAKREKKNIKNIIRDEIRKSIKF